jgi:glucose/arabinose dehydrogenase
LRRVRGYPLLPLFGLLLAVVGPAGPPASALDLPTGFVERTLPIPQATTPSWTNGLQKPTTLDFAPDGKMFVAERNGRVLEFDSVDDSTPTLALSILDEVMAKGDRGLLGMKLDPEYPSKPFIYLSYTYDAPIGGDSALSTHTHNSDGSDNCLDASPYTDCLVSGRLARVELDPNTGVAVGGPLEPPQEALVNSWCQQFTSHSIGDLEFDSEGALLMGGGEGANWATTDYGQFQNPCGDPADQGGSLRAQDVRTPGTASDPTDYSGSIIRVNRETGAAMPDNPFSVNPLFGSEGEDTRARRILAYGLRNPYRFAVQPETNTVYIGDVGQELWDEIDRVGSPPAPGQPALDFGWPCYEGALGGSAPQPAWKALEIPICQSLYGQGKGVTAPFWAYPHPEKNNPSKGILFEGDACNPEKGSAIAGLAFYDRSKVPAESPFPAADDGALFFSDAARGCLWLMREGVDGAPDPTTIENFALPQEADGPFTPVDVVEGPDGSLYVPNFSGNSIVQISYFPANQPPTAELDVDRTYGPVPLTVKLDASGSTDPNLGEGDQIHFAWDLDGDGEFDDSSSPVVERTYGEESNVTVRLRVSDDYNHVDYREVTLYPGDLGPPSAEIELPSPSLEWAIGETLEYAAAATDPDGDSFGSVSKPLYPHWEFAIEHCPSGCHEHPLTGSDTADGSFVIPPHDYPSHLRLTFTATDSRGMSDSKTVEVFPRTISLGVSSEPAGIPLSVGELSGPGPLAVTLIAGGTVTVSAPEAATFDGQPVLFSAWSDGGARIHEVTRLGSDSLAARYVPASPGSVRPARKPSGQARLVLASRPRGVPLRIGAVRRPAPFAVEIPTARATFIRAPRAVRHRGRVLHFRRWLRGGHGAGAKPRRKLIITGDSRFVAVYGAG